MAERGVDDVDAVGVQLQWWRADRSRVERSGRWRDAVRLPRVARRVLEARLLRRPGTGLPRLRWYLLLFELVLALGLGAQSLLRGEAFGLLGVLAAAVLALLRLTDYRRGRLGGLALAVVEFAALVWFVRLLGISAASAAFYGSLYFRSTYARGRQLVVTVVLLAGGLLIGAETVEPATAGAHLDALAAHMLGICFGAALMHLVLSTLLAREAEITAEQEFLDAVLDSVDVPVLACDGDGQPLRSNHAARAAQLQPSALLDADDPGRLRSPETDTPLPGDLLPLRQALAGLVVRDREVVSLVDGRRRDFLVNARQILTPEGATRGAVAALHDITERRRVEEQLARQALHDPLTDLPNRLLLRDRADRALQSSARRAAPPALLFVDLDGFKAVNDSAGHDAGDEVLVLAADRLAGCLRDGDTLARLGGDEFAVLLEEATLDDAIDVAERLRAAVAEPVVVHGTDLVLTASIGVARPGGSSDLDSGELIRNADLAMYAAKGAGKNQVKVYAADMHESLVARVALERELRRALDDGQFLLHYQPVRSLLTSQVVSVEALMRWASPERGLVAPNDFIPLAESTGLIVPLGAWVLREACRQANAWDAEDLDGTRGLAGLGIAVNVSVHQLQSPGLLDAVRGALRDSDLAPHRLTLEITESALGDTGETLRLLRALHQLGVQLAIDDFGTGYSSLARLRLFPVHTVKIDRSFVAEIDVHGEAPLVTATLALAHALGLSTVAEGVETEAQEVFLRDHGCDLVQGFRYSRPVPPRDVPPKVADLRRSMDAGAPGPPLHPTVAAR